MCGIAGIMSVQDRLDGITKNGNRMLDKIAHRGPDGDGSEVLGEGRLWLGHRRLAIIDPDSGKQPLSNEDGAIWVTFNGCIYNYLELRQALKAKGHVFRTFTDTEVIVHAYEEYGVDCVRHFVGMFAFAIWDYRTRTLFCARDRLGIKPFYYYVDRENFVFASEIKAILAHDVVQPRVNENALSEYTILQTVLGNKTMFKGIMKLLPGHHMVVNDKAEIVSVKAYWDVNYDVDVSVAEDYAVDRTRMLLNEVVKIHLRSDVPVGAHLSGGLDSSTIVALTSMIGDLPESLHTFTGAFREGSQYDESKYARIISQSSGTTYHDIYPTAEDFVNYLPRIIYHMDEPAGGPGVFPQFMVSKMASEYVKVVIGGQGGDEIFTGYARYLVAYLEEALKGAIFDEQAPSENNYAATLASIIPNLPLLRQYVPMLSGFWSDGLFESQDSRYFRLMDRSSASKAIFNRDLLSDRANVFDEFQTIFNGSNAKSFVNRMSYYDLKVHLPALLQVEDRTSMAWGLESRVPLLDHRLIEFLASVPPTIKFKGGHPKYLLKKAVRNIVPDTIIDRKDKMGFPVPLQSWFKSTLGPYARDVLLDERTIQRGLFDRTALERALETETQFGRGVWGALCLELWYREFID